MLIRFQNMFLSEFGQTAEIMFFWQTGYLHLSPINWFTDKILFKSYLIYFTDITN